MNLPLLLHLHVLNGATVGTEPLCVNRMVHRGDLVARLGEDNIHAARCLMPAGEGEVDLGTLGRAALGLALPLSLVLRTGY
jgi:hypothetical protein